MNNLVYDIGMHIGEDTYYYLKKGYRVLAVEANPLLVENAKIRFKKEINSGKLTILNLGISDKEEVLPFYKNLRRSEWSSFDRSIGSRNNTNCEVINIQCTTTKKLFDIYGIPFYIKIDIEGNDHFCLSDIPNNGDRPQFVSCEACSLDWLRILQTKGYNKFKIISQGDDYIPLDIKKERKWFYPQYQIIKNGIKLRLQKYVTLKHMYGSSGPFGDETKGYWMSFEETETLYNGFYVEPGKPINNISWFDFHASL